MLVLSRKEGESLVIGNDVVVTVNRISGNRITLGIQAPRHVRIVRGELEPKDAEPREAADAPNGVAESEMTYLEVDASLFGADAHHLETAGR